MSKKEHIDEFIRQKIEEKNFVYKENFWQEAERLIVADEKKKRKRRFFWLFFSLVIFLSIPVVLFNVNKVDVQATQDKHSSKVDNYESNDYSKKIIQKNNSLFSKKSNEKNNENDLKNNKSKMASVHANVSSSNRKNGSMNRKSGTLSLTERSTYNRTIDLNLSTLNQITPERIVNPLQENLQSLDQYIDEKPFKKNAHFVGFGLGTNLSSSLKPGCFAGIRYHGKFSNHFSILSGIGVKMLAVDKIKKEMQSVDYDFGRIDETRIIETKNMYYLEMPLLLKYRVYKQHYLFGGSAINYQMMVKNQITKINEGEFGKVTNHYRETGKSNAFNSWDMQLICGYETRFIKGIKINIAAHYGVQDIVNDPIYREQKNKLKTTEYRIGLSYDLIKIK